MLSNTLGGTAGALAGSSTSFYSIPTTSAAGRLEGATMVALVMTVLMHLGFGIGIRVLDIMNYR